MVEKNKIKNKVKKVLSWAKFIPIHEDFHKFQD